MRERSTITGGFTTPHHLNKYRISDGALLVTGPTTYSGVRNEKLVRDMVTAHFRQLQKCGGFLPLNQFEVVTTDTTIVSGSGSEDFAAANTRWTGEFVPAFDVTLATPAINDSLRDAAVLSAAANASQAAFDVSTWLGEFRESVETLGDIGTRLFHAAGLMADAAHDLATIARRMRHPRRLRKFRGNPRSVWDQFSDLWLLGRYGVRPLIYDFYSAQKAMEVLLKGTAIVRGRGFQQESISLSKVRVVPIDTKTDVTWSETITGTRKYYGMAYCRFSDSTSAAFQYNPLVTAWELTPYSFIVDWFIDVGSWVQTLAPQLNGDYLGIAVGVRTETVYAITYREDAHGGIVGGQSGARKTIVVNSYTRDPATVPFPPLLPRLSIPKVLDLLTIFLRGKGKVNQRLNRR